MSVVYMLYTHRALHHTKSLAFYSPDKLHTVACNHAREQTNPHTYIHTYILTHTPTYTHIYTHTHAHIHTYIHTNE